MILVYFPNTGIFYQFTVKKQVKTCISSGDSLSLSTSPLLFQIYIQILYLMTYSDQTTRLPLFGSPIVTGIARSSYITETGLIIPGVVARCFQEINKNLKVEGLFRRSGASPVLNQLQEQFERCDDPFKVIPAPSVTTVHYWTGLLKRYLQLLPEPLIPQSHQILFLEAFNTERPLEKLQEVIYNMPLEHRNLLIYLLQSILNMVEHGDTNQMTAATMAIIVAPTCIHIDAVSQLMQQSTPSLKSTPTTSWQKATNRLFGFAKRKRSSGINQSLSSLSTRSVPFPLYQPQHILQLDIVKQSSQWTLLLEYLITNSFLLLKTTTQAKAPERVSPQYPRSLPVIHNISSSALSSSHSRLSSVTSEGKKSSPAIDITNLEFPASRDLLNIFQDVCTPVCITEANVAAVEPRQKYVNTLKHWRAREEQAILQRHSIPDKNQVITMEANGNTKAMLHLWGKKSLFTEQTLETNIPPSHLQLYQ
ncbi:Rho GTPase activation protein, partial [Absidia repens]